MSRRVCPWWLGYFLASPIRKLAQHPEEIVSPYLSEGNWALDVGSGMGFFSLPMAQHVGSSGHVVCVDLQEKMIRTLRKRATRKGLIGRMEFRVCSPTSLNLQDLRERFDFALAFAVVHEVPDPERLFFEIHASMKQSGLLLFSEPSGHVSEEGFKNSLSLARDTGFVESGAPHILHGFSRVLKKGGS